MAFYGKRGDVNNSIPVTSAYPGGRNFGKVAPSATRGQVRNNSAGETASVSPANAASGIAPETAGIMGRPTSWWLTFAVVFVLFVWGARKLAPEAANEAGIRFNLYNAVFLTLWIVLILNLLKVFAAKVSIPGLSEMILAA